MNRLAFLSFLLLILPAWGAEPIRVMLLDGESAGAYHAWKLTTPVLKRELEETGLFRVDVVTAPPSSTGNFGSFRPNFSNYRAIIFNYDAPDWPPVLKDTFEGYMKDGGGLVIVHAADNAFAGWSQYNEMVGVGGW